VGKPAPQLDLFAPKRSAIRSCPREADGGPLCARAEQRPGGCIGREACEALGEQEAQRLQDPVVWPRPDVERRMQEIPAPDLDEIVEIELGGGRPAPSLPEVIAQANLDLGKDADSIELLKRAKRLAQDCDVGFSQPGRICGSCGSTTGVVLYANGPLAGQLRCWACARPALEGK
jgi:hypothetical protein